MIDDRQATRGFFEQWRSRGKRRLNVLGEAIDATPFGVIVGRLDGRYLAANRMACLLLGYEREELVALSAREVSGRSWEAVEALSRRLSREGELSGSGPLRRKDGRIIEVEYVAGLIRLGGADAYVAIILGIRPPSSAGGREEGGSG